jgi:hypothetical protein
VVALLDTQEDGLAIEVREAIRGDPFQREQPAEAVVGGVVVEPEVDVDVLAADIQRQGDGLLGTDVDGIVVRDRRGGNALDVDCLPAQSPRGPISNL